MTTSERGGFVNLERLPAAGGEPVALTRVTGAAVARGRRARTARSGFSICSPRATICAASSRTACASTRRCRASSSATRSPASCPPGGRRAPIALVARTVRARRALRARYGFGPSRFRYVPSVSSGYGGSTMTLAFVRSDPVGRLGIPALGAAGTGALPAGGAIAITSRARRTVIGINGWYSHEAPSRELAAALAEGLDLARSGGAVRIDRRRVRDAGELMGMLAVVGEVQRPSCARAVTASRGDRCIRRDISSGGRGGAVRDRARRPG